MFKIGLGQDSHRINSHYENDTSQILLAGVPVGIGSMLSNSDGDVVLHAITNAISSVSGVNILGAIADEMARQGILDSSKYLERALETLGEYEIKHIAISIECEYPRLSKHIDAMRENIAVVCGISSRDVGITATSGEGLTDFGRGLGVQALAVITCMKRQEYF